MRSAPREARTWFYVAGWPLLDATACTILNMAARKLFPAPDEPSRAQLEDLARAYRPGATVSGLVARFTATSWIWRPL